eukprot:scaffold181321_cov29-Tisochrysis_lutea.AAC.1
MASWGSSGAVEGGWGSALASLASPSPSLASPTLGAFLAARVANDCGARRAPGESLDSCVDCSAAPASRQEAGAKDGCAGPPRRLRKQTSNTSAALHLLRHPFPCIIGDG